LLVVLWAVALALAVGCGPNPACEDWEAAMNAMYERCAIPIVVSLRFPDGSPATCGDVHEIEDSHLVACECIPWTEEVDCEVLRADPSDVDPTCNPDFRYYVTDGM
jgi:hypothetical protein